MNLEHIDLPNELLKPNWCKTKHHIDDLCITDTNIMTIEPNAFADIAFKGLRSITFDNSNITFQQGILTSLENLIDVAIMQSNFIGNLSSLLYPVRKSVHIFYHECIPNNVELIDLFGNYRLSNLSLLSLECVATNYDRILEPKLFKNLPVLRTLMIVACRITTIETGTFDYVAHTLRYITMVSNNLKQLEPNTFFKLCDQCPFPDEFTCNWRRIIWLIHNPLECDCNFYEIQSMILASFHLWQNNFIMQCTNNKTLNLIEKKKCNNLQLIHTRKMCVRIVDWNEHVYPKYNLKLIHGDDFSMISIKSWASGHARLLLLSQIDNDFVTKQKCSDKKMLQSTIKCWLVHRNATIPYENDQSLSRACIIYQIASKTAWPLHCITIQTIALSKNSHKMYVYIMWTIGVVGCFGTGLMVGLAHWFCDFQSHYDDVLFEDACCSTT